MTHEELLERVAKALCVAAGEFPETATPYNRNVDFLWQHYIPSARAALAEVLAVLKEPTEEMLVEAEEAVPGLMSFAEKQESPSYIAWRAMLSASPLALEDKHNG